MRIRSLTIVSLSIVFQFSQPVAGQNPVAPTVVTNTQEVSNKSKSELVMNSFVDTLIGKMTLAEKIGQLNLVNPGDQPLTGSAGNSKIERKLLDGNIGMMFGTASLERRTEIQKICCERTRLKIPMLFASDVIHGYRTALPLPLAQSCSWDLDLIREAAHISATEARADGIDLTFAPMVDITRDARWGRVAEGNGESPRLAAMCADAAVRGYQGDENKGSTSDVDRVLSCVKHFAGYGAADGGREYAAVNIGPIELHESHLPPFAAAVDANVAAVMPGFHTIDRTPVTAHRVLLQDVLRRQLGFAGAVISDYTAINELTQHGLGDQAAAATAAIRAGVDLDMVGEAYLHHLEKLIAADKIDAALVDEACRRVLVLKYKAGLFDAPFRYLDSKRAAEVIGCKSHRDAARKMVSQTCVLLKNDGDVLPILPPTATTAKLRLAIIGPLVEDIANLPGTWSVNAKVEDSVSLRTGLEQVAAEIPGDQVVLSFAKGCNLVDDPQLVKRLNVFETTVTLDARSSKEMLAEATALANESDVVVLAVGEAREHSGECSSRVDLQIPPPQRDLVRAMKATGKPVVLVLFAGRPLVLTEIVDQVDAILYVWYPGSLAGPGIADVLLGRTAPSARLTMSMPRSVGQVPVHHDSLPTGRPLAKGVEYEKFKSCYLDESSDPLFPFGYGLSYTSFEHSAVAAKLDGETISIEAKITNTGSRDGIEVVQCYVAGNAAMVSQPKLRLLTFDRMSLSAGESDVARFEISKADVAVAHGSSLSEVTRTFVPGKYRFSVGPNAHDLTEVEVDWP